MSDPTQIKALDWHGFPAHPRRALPIETVERQHHPRRRLRGVQVDPSDSAHCSKPPPTPDTSALVGAENAAREESKGHLIRTSGNAPARRSRRT